MSMCVRMCFLVPLIGLTIREPAAIVLSCPALHNVQCTSPPCLSAPCLFPSFQICNAVVVAHMLNATLVLPELDANDFWNDSR